MRRDGGMKLQAHIVATVLLGAAVVFARGAVSAEAGRLDRDGRMEMKLAAFDIAPFALPNTAPGEIRFEEPRDIVGVVVEFRKTAPEGIGLSYLRKTWPETRLEEVNEAEVCQLGWAPQDDWFNVQWQTAAAIVSRENGHRVRISFLGLKNEFPHSADYNVTFRRTLGVRVDVSDPSAIHSVSVFTASPPVRTNLRVELDAGRPTPGKSTRFAGYNLMVEAVTSPEGVAVDGKAIALSDSPPRGFNISVGHMAPVHRYCGDDGLLTFLLDDDAFTISLTSLEEEGPVWCEHLGIFITRAGDPTTFEDYRRRVADSRTISQRVLERPEQSLPAALHGQPRAHPVSYNLGCTHARQRFWIEPNGDVLLHKQNVTWVTGKDTPRFRSKANARFFFGLAKWIMVARFPDPAPILVYNLQARRGNLVVEQKSFAVPLLTSIKSGPWAGDDPMVALVRFRFRNDGPDPIRAELPLRYSQDSERAYTGLPPYRGAGGYLVPGGPVDQLTFQGDRIYSDWQGDPVLRCALVTTMKVTKNQDGLLIDRELESGETCDVILKIPYIALESDEELSALDGLEFERCYQETAAYWRQVGHDSAQVHTPVPQLDALHASHLSHVLVTDFLMPDGSGLVNTSVGTSTYGNFSNESCMVVHDLDQRGLHDEARKRLGIWVKYQGTVPQPGNFTDYNGMFYGAGGFECGTYNQHHGWVLWCLCEHYFLTRDEAWFRSVADSVVAGADWIFRQRRGTMTALPHSRGWEYGFLPAGSLEDVSDFCYWLSTNALTWRGAEWAARALEAIGHPEAPRLRREADAYKEDLVQGFETMRRQSPVVRLRDGRWVPHYPSRLYRRGREVGWIRETLEGAVYLLISRLYDVHTPQAEWILEDYQDNRYIRPPYGYFIPDFRLTWFDRGGFSIQPNLLAGLLPYLERDEPELYIWMFYNTWAACYREEINAMIEIPMPVLGYSNAAHFKTSDEANAMTWLRYMFVYPLGDTLYFGRAIPRAWAAQNEPYEVRDVATPFGDVGIRYLPKPEEKALMATLTLRLDRAPGRVLVRFRTPRAEPLRNVLVNDAPYPCTEPEKGDVDVTGLKGVVKIDATY